MTLGNRAHGKAHRLMLAGAAAALMAVAPGARAQSYTITNLVNSGENRPDGIPWYVFGPPSIDGTNIVFLTANAQVFATLDGIWGIDTSKSLTPVQLAGLTTPVPGGSGNFTGFGIPGNSTPTIANGTAVFYGTDSSGLPGIFAMPAGGGTISKIVTTATAAPDGGTFTQVGSATTNGKLVAFYGQTSAGHSGIYQSSTTGHGLKTLINNTTTLAARDGGDVPCPGNEGLDPNYFGAYTSPVASKSRVSFFATGIGDPSLYPNAIFDAVKTIYNNTADNCSSLTGDTNPNHVQITGYSADRLSNVVAFAAHDGSYAGIFATTGSNMKLERAYATTSTAVPGAGDDFTSFSGFALDKSGLGFVGNDATNGYSLYITAAARRPISVVALASQYGNIVLGDRSVSQGRMVFYTGSIFSNAIWLAAP